MTDQNFDVIVLGGGIVGAATADVLTQRGHKTLLLDQYARGHEHGSSHGDGRVIRYDYPEPFYLEMCQRVFPMWDTLSERAGRPLKQTTGLWSSGPIGHPELQALKRNFEENEIPYESLTAAESNRRFPFFRLEEGSEAYFQPDGGVNFATPAVEALWQLAEAGGATTRSNTRITKISMQNDTVTVQSDTGQQWQAARLIITVGGWAQEVLGMLNLTVSMEVTQEQLAYFPNRSKIDHTVNNMPVFVDYHTDHPFYGLPQVEIPGVKVGWHHTGSLLSHPTKKQPINRENLAGVQNFIRQRMPHLDADAPFSITTCLYTNTPDYHFIIDRHPDWPQIVIGAGFSGHGFKFGPLLGQILSDLAFDDPPPISLAPFRLSRLNDLAQLEPRTAA